MDVSRTYLSNEKPKQPIPLAGSTVTAGFPSPADDYLEKRLSLDELLVGNRPATFFMRVSGEAMSGAGIISGDIVIVDRALEPKDGRIVVVVLNGEFVVRRLRMKSGVIRLDAENPEIESIEWNNDCDLEIWGVVTYAIHTL